MIFDISHNNILRIAELISGYSNRFMTSADVVMSVSGLRFEAICAIAREQGIVIESKESRCIDENLLSELANAHIRQLKSYFKKCKRHLSELSSTELLTFIEFNKTFQKHTLYINKELTWENIDTDVIRNQFLRKVHSLTKTSSTGKDFIFCGISPIGFFIESRSCDHDSLELILQSRQKDVVLARVFGCRWFYYRPKIHINCNLDNRDNVRRVTLFARYHIFSDDDNHIAC